MTDPGMLNPGDLIFMADEDAREIYPQRLFVVDENLGPEPEQTLDPSLRGKNAHTVAVRCPEPCGADNCAPGRRHPLLLTSDSFVLAADVVWR